jgi:hypothetical protein
LKELTGAKYMVMDADVPVIESGGKEDFQYGNAPDNLYKPTKVDRVLHDGDEVKLGGAVLMAHKTPGHTKGCTTWTMRTADAGKTYDVVIVGSPNVNPGYKLVNNEKYWRIAEDYEQTFRVLKSLPCDVFWARTATITVWRRSSRARNRVRRIRLWIRRGTRVTSRIESKLSAQSGTSNRKGTVAAATRM